MKKVIALSILSLSLLVSNSQSVQATGGGTQAKTQQVNQTNSSQKMARISSQSNAAIPATATKVKVANASKLQVANNSASLAESNKRLVSGNNQPGDNHPKVSGKKAKQQQAAKLEFINQQKQQTTNTHLRAATKTNSAATEIKK